MRRKPTLHVGVESLEARLPLSADVTPYNIGSPALVSIWVDPVHGSDTNSGATRGQALQSLAAAWNMIPQDHPLTATGYQIQLTAGDYAASLLPSSGWTSDRVGTYACPVIFNAVDGPLTARIHGTLDCQNDSYLYMIGLNFVTDPGGAGGGNVVQFASDDHLLVRSCQFNGNDGTTNEPQETFKANQCQYVYVESSDIAGAFWFGLDFVAVQYGHILNTQVHNTGDDGLVLKGGSADITVEGCTIHDIGNVGFAAGQGSGFEFMVAPWLHYEAYDLKFVNNVVYNTQNAGAAVRGGYNILIADNTFYKVGLDQGAGATLLLFSPGGRTDDGDSATCLIHHNLGGWGPTTAGDGGEWIPNKDIDVFDNIFDNPAGSTTMWGDFTIFGPTAVPAGNNLPSSILSDDNLQIAGNLFWNGSADAPLGDDNGHDSRLLAANTFLTAEPQFVNTATHDFRPLSGGNLFSNLSIPIPNFLGGDRPTTPQPPQGDLSNAVLYDRLGNLRMSGEIPGSYVSSTLAPSRPLYPSEILLHLYAPGLTSVPITAPSVVATPAAASTHGAGTETAPTPVVKSAPIIFAPPRPSIVQPTNKSTTAFVAPTTRSSFLVPIPIDLLADVATKKPRQR